MLNEYWEKSIFDVIVSVAVLLVTLLMMCSQFYLVRAEKVYLWLGSVLTGIVLTFSYPFVFLLVNRFI